MSRPVVVLGLGNLLMGDDGVGVFALAALAAEPRVPAGARLLDGGTLGLSLLPYVRSAPDLVLIDAVRGEGPPGSLVRLEGDEVPGAVLERLSVHQVGVADLVAGARLLGGWPERIVLCGVVPERIELGVELSPAVRAAVPALVAMVLGELERLAVEVAA
ncbi:MAG TPA: HyaD/HybD family hydrogenase maturation endopeptidase [Kofleriaceae bacterium]|nr:HyaD/HybD family hydrogenase maturation endopeptidase [Kofleriaceae bacterium]